MARTVTAVVVDAYASLRHYADHLAPIWDQLPPDVRGTFWAPDHSRPWGEPLRRDRDTSRLVVVAGYADALAMNPSQLVLVEHGAGQTYLGRGVGNGAYPGGFGHGGVCLFVAPNRHVADAWRAVYPDTPVVVVGCPKLDRWHQTAGTADRPAVPARVAVTFHWECALVPETRSAWRHYDRALPALAGDPRWQLLGHGHPRLWNTIKQRWSRLGVTQVRDLADVFDQADVLVGDNTSALYEFASLGRPVVVLNAPWYRRDVHHGLRFWDYPPGLQVDHPDQLADAIAAALDEGPTGRAVRARAVARAYAHTDGRAAERAATAIMEAHDARPVPQPSEPALRPHRTRPDSRRGSPHAPG